MGHLAFSKKMSPPLLGHGSPTMRSMFPPLLGEDHLPLTTSIFPQLVENGHLAFSKKMSPPLVGLKRFDKVKNLFGLIYVISSFCYLRIQVILLKKLQLSQTIYFLCYNDISFIISFFQTALINVII